MVNTVYLHIGMNKTGSSAIQHYLAKNFAALSLNSVLYPMTGRRGNAHYGLSTLLGFDNTKASASVDSKAVSEAKRVFDKEVQHSNCKNIVVSSEFFVLPRPLDAVRYFFDDYKVRVVVYVRRHDKWWPSAYNQAVRTVVQPPWGRTFKSYLNFFARKRPWVGDYRLLLDRWAEVFGKDNLILRPYESKQNEPGLAYDFMRAIDNEALAKKVQPETVRINNSIGTDALAMVDAFQRAKIEPEVRDELIRNVIATQDAVTCPGAFEPSFLLDLVARYQDDYVYLAKQYLGRDDGKLFYDALPDASGEWSRIKQPSLDAVVESVVAVMKSMPVDKIKALA